VGISETAQRLETPPLHPTVSLQEVDIRSELSLRAPRARDLAREHHALGVLAAELGANPANLLQKFAELVVDLCLADSAGVSLIDGDLVRWEAVAGVFKNCRRAVMRRTESPCGVCVAANATQLMHLPDRCFPALYAKPRFVELLIVPFREQRTPCGAVWIASHTADRKFDRSDEGIIDVLAGVASAGWHLWKTSEAALQTNRRKDDLLAALGHELRNPLAAIASATSLLHDTVEETSRARRAVDVLRRQSRHLARMVDDLLDAGRIASGKLGVQRERLDLVELLQQVVDTFRGITEKQAQRLTLQLPARPVWIDGDAVRLTQVFANLIDNAAKYTPSSGTITVRCVERRGGIDIVVSDTGQGLRSDQLNAIFEPFAQLLDPSAGQATGLGLGLALVRAIVALHEGTVEAHSDGPGSGSRFTVRLPTRSDESSAPDR